MGKRTQPAPDSNLRIDPTTAVGLLGAAAVLIAYKVQQGIPWKLLLDDFTSTPWALLPSAQALARHAANLISATSFCAGQVAIGSWILRVGGLSLNSVYQRISFGFCIGFASFSTFVLVLGLLSLWPRVILAGLYWSVSSVGLLSLLFAAYRARAMVKELPEDGRFWFGVAGLFALWGVNLRLALVPETFYDSLVYHQGLPQLYLNAGALVPAGWNSYAGIPSQPQMLNLLALAADASGVQSNVAHALMLPLIWASMCALGRRMGSNWSGWLSAGIFTSMPIVMAESFRTSVGLASSLMQLCFFSAATHAVLEEDPEQRKRWLWLSGIGLGCAAATKYTAWILPVAVLAMMRMRGDDEDRRVRLLSPAEAATLLGVSALVLSPWIVKNLLHYGNPVYPFFHHFFAPTSVLHPDAASMSLAKPLTRLLTLEGLEGFLLHPIQWLAPSTDIAESIGLVLPLAVCALPFLKPGKLERRQTVFMALCWIPLVLTTDITRYFLPVYALMAFLSAQAVLSSPPSFKRPVLAALFLSMALVDTAWLVGLSGWKDRLAVYAGRREASSYLADAGVSYPAPQFSGIDFLNSLPEQRSGVLLFGDPRGLYLKRPFLSATPDQPFTLEVWAKEAADAAALRERFRRENIGYVLSNYGELSRRRVSLQLDPNAKRALDDFWKNHTERVFSRREDGVAWVEVRRVL